MQYKIHKTLTGKLRVKYPCPHCGDALESELAEAGHKDKCPTCQREYVVPGEDKRKQVEAELRKQAEAKKQAEAERLAKEQAENTARENARREALQRKLEQQELERREAEERAAAYRVEQNAATERATALERARNQRPENVTYPALEVYIFILRICGYVCIAGAVALVGVYFLVMVYLLWQRELTPETFISGAISCIIGVVGALLPALGFFVAAQLLQLALDARRDLAKLVARQSNQ